MERTEINVTTGERKVIPLTKDEITAATIRSAAEKAINDAECAKMEAKLDFISDNFPIPKADIEAAFTDLAQQKIIKKLNRAANWLLKDSDT